MAAEDNSTPPAIRAGPMEEELADETIKFCKLSSWEQSLKAGNSHGWHLFANADDAVIMEILNFRKSGDIAWFRSWFEQTLIFATVYVKDVTFFNFVEKNISPE